MTTKVARKEDERMVPKAERVKKVVGLRGQSCASDSQLNHSVERRAHSLRKAFCRKSIGGMKCRPA